MAVVVVATIVMVTVIDHNMSDSSSDPISSLESTVDFLDTAAWIAIAISVVCGGMLLHYKSRLAEEQRKQIASLQLSLSEHELKIATVNKNAEDAKGDAILARKGLAEAQAEAERERIKRLNLQGAIAPREIDPDGLAKELREFLGYTIIIDFFGELETELLVGQFKDALTQANIIAKGGIQMMTAAGPDWSGVKLFGHLNGLQPDAEIVRLAFTIRSHFSRHNVPVEILHASNKELLDSKVLRIRIGIKPPIKMPQ